MTRAGRSRYPDYDRATVHAAFSARAEAMPQAPAVQVLTERGVENTLTYQQLETKSSELADHLRSLGVGPEQTVGVFLRRTPDLLVALLGILKAGGAYVPVDVDGPDHRRTFMFEQARVRLVITERKLRERLSTSRSLILVLDDPRPEDVCRDDLAVRTAGGNNLAYIIFTSGSTGRPKGVMVSHSALLNYVKWSIAAYRLEPDGCVPLHGSVEADMSVTSIWSPLLSGCSVLILEQGTSVSPLERALESGVAFSLLKLTPSHLGALSHGLQTDDSSTGPRCLVVGGEPLRYDLTWLWQTHGGVKEIFNEYGPTETVVGSTVHRVPEQSGYAGNVPIGQPIAGTTLRVLDPDMNEVPDGEAGELFIGGTGVGRGYVGSPGLTAERFVPDPYSNAPGGERLYRTGDLVRLMPDRNLEFLGRVDEQIKIRGYRVEPGEVEAALRAEDSVKEAVVIGQEARGGSRLAAFVVFSAKVPSLTVLKASLRQRLPEHMIPSSIIALEQIPRLPSGKVDRKALPSAEASKPDSTTPTAAPTSSVEEELAAIWMEVLGLDKVGIHDDFFELGGDSILSVHVTGRAREVGLNLHLNDIFLYPTIAELGSKVRRGPVAVTDTVTDGDLEMTPVQLWWFEQQPSEPDHFNQSLVLAPAEHLDVEPIERALDAVVTRSPALRMQFIRDGQAWRQRAADPIPKVIVVDLDLSRLPEARQKAVMEKGADACQADMDIGRGKLVSATLFRLGGNRGNRLLLAIHHLAVDVLSWAVFLEDLTRALKRITGGLNPELPSTTTPPWRWAERLRSQVESGMFDPEHEYWLAQGRKAATPHPLLVPADTRPIRTESTEHSFTPELTRLFREVVDTSPVRAEEILLAALFGALQRESGSEQLLVDIERHGRLPLAEDIDISSTVGWFTAIHPLLIEAPRTGAPRDILASVRAAFGDVPKGGVGYLALRQLGSQNVRRSFRQVREAECAFNYLGVMESANRGEGLFELAEAPRGLERGPGNQVRYVLTVDVVVVADQLRTRWSYRQLKKSLVKRLIEYFESALRETIVSGMSGDQHLYRATDFELADLDQETLDRILSRIDKGH